GPDRLEIRVGGAPVEAGGVRGTPRPFEQGVENVPRCIPSSEEEQGCHAAESGAVFLGEGGLEPRSESGRHRLLGVARQPGDMAGNTTLLLDAAEVVLAVDAEDRAVTMLARPAQLFAEIQFQQFEIRAVHAESGVNRQVIARNLCLYVTLAALTAAAHPRPPSLPGEYVRAAPRRRSCAVRPPCSRGG